MPTVQHFEIPADNVKRAKNFYKKLFGWKFEIMDKDMDYWSIKTGEHEKIIGGGLMKRQMKDQTPVNFVTVKSVQKSISQATKMGGDLIAPKETIPKMGHWAIVTDTEHNPVGLWQEDKKAM